MWPLLKSQRLSIFIAPWWQAAVSHINPLPQRQHGLILKFTRQIHFVSHKMVTVTFETYSSNVTSSCWFDLPDHLRLVLWKWNLIAAAQFDCHRSHFFAHKSNDMVLNRCFTLKIHFFFWACRAGIVITLIKTRFCPHFHKHPLILHNLSFNVIVSGTAGLFVLLISLSQRLLSSLFFLLVF